MKIENKKLKITDKTKIDHKINQNSTLNQFFLSYLRALRVLCGKIRTNGDIVPLDFF
jgi:hypothetical protein